jgi:predicted TIM-barrel fold metal-dependent hydrolase
MAHPYFELRDVDRRFWNERIAPFLPDKVFDAHRHITPPQDLEPFTPERLKQSWTFEVAVGETLEEAKLGYFELFPGKSVSFLAFGWPIQECHVKENNAYLMEGLRESDSAMLVLTRPEAKAEQVAEWLRRPRVIGIKPYQDLIRGFKGQDVSIFDFCPPEHLQVLDEVGGWLTLHIPRQERLADPDNIAEIRDIRQRYPRIVLVLAHIGRAYTGRYVREGLPALAEDKGILFDTSAVLNPAVHAIALDRVGPERLLFGSDFPIFYMRGRQRWEGDKYINLTDGNYSWNLERQPPAVEADYTLYIYEAMAACIDTYLALGFDEAALRAIFHNNAHRIVSRILLEKSKW